MKKLLYILIMSMMVFGLSAGLLWAPTQICGDGTVQSPEQCDDGNTIDGDGCDATCMWEPEEPYCGDGIVNQSWEQCDDGNDVPGDGCESDCTFTPPTGLEGCTPGYWKNHLDKWTLAPGDIFDVVVGGEFFDPDITLVQAINMGGGHVKKLARHGTAAMLNADNPNVEYPLTLEEVKAAILAGNAGMLADFNELSDECPAED